MSECDRILDTAQAILEARTDLPELPLDQRIRMLLHWCELIRSDCEDLAVSCIEVGPATPGRRRICRCRSCHACGSMLEGRLQIQHRDGCKVDAYYPDDPRRSPTLGAPPGSGGDHVSSGPCASDVHAGVARTHDTAGTIEESL